MKIVFLDVKTIGEDIDLSGFDRWLQELARPTIARFPCGCFVRFTRWFTQSGKSNAG